MGYKIYSDISKFKAVCRYLRKNLYCLIDIMNVKETYEDKFARRYWCRNASRRYTKFIKRRNRKLLRKIKGNEAKNHPDN